MNAKFVFDLFIRLPLGRRVGALQITLKPKMVKYSAQTIGFQIWSVRLIGASTITNKVQM